MSTDHVNHEELNQVTLESSDGFLFSVSASVLSGASPYFESLLAPTLANSYSSHCQSIPLHEHSIFVAIVLAIVRGEVPSTEHLNSTTRFDDAIHQPFLQLKLASQHGWEQLRVTSEATCVGSALDLDSIPDDTPARVLKDVIRQRNKRIDYFYWVSHMREQRFGSYNDGQCATCGFSLGGTSRSLWQQFQLAATIAFQKQPDVDAMLKDDNVKEKMRWLMEHRSDCEHNAWFDIDVRLPALMLAT
ncbi:hypothetical protein BKA62DRAFT_833808 [Auriculariales sp. MPI-PUGE-AT-0066]|nr:hypothetical protein BKA62DRAFT_833808 [Auriculariales sp. MPI-PUGE-AT-0066]